MIIFNTLSWSNIFSYGEGNSISLDKNRLTQITGKNGHGKSAIAIILQEILYGKNIKNIKKEDLFNRYINKPTIAISVTFTDEEDNYEVKLSRLSTVKLALLKNGYDISSHTATGTYKQIQEIIGYDFKTFVQITSQSSKTGLAFLTATDTTRKNFLINFLNLEEYNDTHNLFKNLLKESNKLVNELKGSINTIEDWIKKHKEIDTQPIELKDNINNPADLIKQVSILEEEYKDAEKINKNISKNEQYKLLLKNISTEELSKNMPVPEPIDEYQTKLGEYKNIVNNAFSSKKQYENLGEICHTCGQDIDKTMVDNIVSKANEDIHNANIEIANLTEKINEITEYTKLYNEHINLISEFERLMNLVDNNMSSKYVDKKQTEIQIEKLNKEIKDISILIDKINEHNLKAEAHNSKIKVISEQLIEYGSLLKVKEDEFIKIAKKAKIQEIIKDAFSTKGIVAYKIESLIKDLEKLINLYLSELSDGRFLIEFILSGDKLNIDIITNSKSVTIESLSEGELSRVNVATLLALRKMMSAISTNKLNILFLDEITAVLDEEGKEKLVEMLLDEEDLNTFLIAHDYSHPLIPTIQVLKSNNISEVIDG